MHWSRFLRRKACLTTSSKRMDIKGGLNMSRNYNIIDSDGHVLEPPDFWEEYIDPKYRGRTPELVVDTDGKERLRIEGKIYGGARGLGFAGAIGARQGEASTNIKYVEG